MEFLCEKGTAAIDFEEERYSLAYKKVKSVNPELAAWLWNKRSISYERFWEIALAGLKKNVQWSNITGMDHSDGTEVKTARISLDIANGTFCASVGNTNTKTGNMKVVVYNPHKKDFIFLFLSKQVKDKHSDRSEKGKLKMTFPKYRDPTGWWVNYVVPFEKFIKL